MNGSKIDMYQYEGKNVVVHFADGTAPIQGRCVSYTPGYDNDPEIDSIDIKTGAAYVSIDVPDIASIDING